MGIFVHLLGFQELYLHIIPIVRRNHTLRHSVEFKIKDSPLGYYGRHDHMAIGNGDVSVVATFSCILLHQRKIDIVDLSRSRIKDEMAHLGC